MAGWIDINVHYIIHAACSIHVYIIKQTIWVQRLQYLFYINFDISRDYYYTVYLAIKSYNIGVACPLHISITDMLVYCSCTVLTNTCRFGGKVSAQFCALYSLYNQYHNDTTIDIYSLAYLYHMKRPGIWENQVQYYTVFCFKTDSN